MYRFISFSINTKTIFLNLLRNPLLSPKSLTTFWNSSSRTLGKLDSVNNGLQNIRPCWLKSTKYKTEIHFLLCSQHTEECLAGAPATSEEDTFKWRVPFRLPKTIHNFEVRLGPPGGDKVRHSVSKTYDWHDYDLPGLQSDHWSGPSLHRNVLVDQWTAAAWAHRGQGWNLLLQGEKIRKIRFINRMIWQLTFSGTRRWQWFPGKTELSSFLHHQWPKWWLRKKDRVRKRWVGIFLFCCQQPGLASNFPLSPSLIEQAAP